MKVYAYIRVSTQRQNYDRQIQNIRKTYPEYPAIEIFQEKRSGKYGDEIRVEWKKLKAAAQPGDVIIFDSVSRMSRDVETGVADYFDLYGKGIELKFVNEPQVNTSVYRSAISERLHIAQEGNTGAVDNLLKNLETTLNAFMRDLAADQIRAAFGQSEKERADIAQRVKDGMAATGAARKISAAKKGNAYETKKSKAAKEVIRKRSQDFDGNLNDKDLMALMAGSGMKLARNSYFKYKRELREALYR